MVFWLWKLKTSLNGNIETRPGHTQKNQNKSFSICHWNLSIITTHGYAEVSLLKTYIAVHIMDIIFLLETCLDSSIQSEDDNLEIPGCNLVRFDHPSNNKRGGVCIYFKALLPLRVIDTCFLQECIIHK